MEGQRDCPYWHNCSITLVNSKKRYKAGINHNTELIKCNKTSVFSSPVTSDTSECSEVLLCGVWGVDLHFLDGLLPFLRGVKGRIRQHVEFRRNKVSYKWLYPGFMCALTGPGVFLSEVGTPPLGPRQLRVPSASQPKKKPFCCL